MRVLRPGGRLVVCAWLAGNELRGWEERWLVEPVCREGRLPGMGTEGEYASWIESAGLILENRLEISRQVSRTWPICAARFALALLRRPGYIKFVMDPKNDNRVFAFTMLRIWLAYRTGAMRYIVFTASKPQQEAS
jgi:tocopherol O-methyltransferase